MSTNTLRLLSEIGDRLQVRELTPRKLTFFTV